MGLAPDLQETPPSRIHLGGQRRRHFRVTGPFVNLQWTTALQTAVEVNHGEQGRAADVNYIYRVLTLVTT